MIVIAKTKGDLKFKNYLHFPNTFLTKPNDNERISPTSKSRAVSLIFMPLHTLPNCRPGCLPALIQRYISQLANRSTTPSTSKVTPQSPRTHNHLVLHNHLVPIIPRTHIHNHPTPMHSQNQSQIQLTLMRTVPYGTANWNASSACLLRLWNAYLFCFLICLLIAFLECPTNKLVL